MKIELPEEAMDALRRLVDLGPSVLSQILRSVESSPPTLVAPTRRASELGDVLSTYINTSDLEKSFKYLFYPAHDVRNRFNLTAGELFSAFLSFLNSSEAQNWTSEDSQKLEGSREAIIGIFASDRLSQEAKARSLLESRPNHVRSLGILTDTRPVFDDSGEKIFFYVTAHSLKIRYKNNDSISTMYFSLDSQDLEELERQIRRAKQKTRSIGRVQEKTEIPVLTAMGEESRDDSNSEGSVS